MTPIKQKGGKIVHAWAFKGDCDPSAIVSDKFTMEWPLPFVEQPWRAGWDGPLLGQGELMAEIGTSFLEAQLGLPHDYDKTNINKWMPEWIEQIGFNSQYLIGP